ncbi:MAG TPA: peptide deformylase, partial [Deltaproteobacteria bacterium]|nr:peptide deformylase [Deltaproteobacteria bacterium]
RASEIDSIDGSIVMLADEMKEAMYRAPGVGLAAPQVGVSRRLILVDPSAGKEPGRLMVIVNPVIIDREGTVTDSEMCLSVPELSVDVKRAERIYVKGASLTGKDVSIEAHGYLARILQHEIDHLDGKVILDYASSLKRAIYLKKIKKGSV